MKRYNIFVGGVICTFLLISLLLCGCNKERKTNETTAELSTTKVENTVELTTERVEYDFSYAEGIVQPSKNAENYFLEKVEITTFVEPDERGYYVVEESQWTLDIKNKSVDEEVETRKEEMGQLGVEVIYTSTDTDASAAFVFDKENYYKMVSVVEDTTNDRVGLYGEKISISKDFDEVIMYVDENTKLEDFCTRMSLMYWSVFQCQAYSGVKAKEIHITLKIANIDTEEILIEFNLDKNTSFNISEEEWVEILR